MNWSALTKKQQQMVFATVILAVVQILLLAYFLGWMSPSSSNGGSAKEELRELQEKLDDARAVLGRSEIIKKGLGESIRKLEVLEVYTPSSSDRYAWAYEYVSLRATRAGVELDNLEEIIFVDDAKKSAANEPYEISVSTQCGYNELVGFLWQIEGGNALLRIKEVEISRLPDTSLRQQVRIVIQWPATIEIKRGSGG
ncbi:MAG: hypothetical protein JEZ10_07490 [Verrucomicrobia bacterium]|nr:hypothetical protein [Verrucomicrobiota bacterium]